VAVLNDVDAGTYAEFVLGSGKGAHSLLGVFPGTGLGAAFVYEGNILRGKNISCMELGNIWLPGTHLNSTLPGVALLEDLTSRLGIAAASSVECYRGKSPVLDGKTNASLREMKSKALTASFKARESTVNVFNNSVHYLGMGIAMVVNLLGPDHIILGGGLVEEMPRYYLDQVRLEVGRYAIPEFFRGIKFSVAKLGDQAVAVGSVAWLRKDNVQL
jgi:glucokinase